MKVCVTGGAGFIGSHLVDRLVAEGHSVTVLDDLSTGSLENLATSRSRVRLVEGDVRDESAVALALEGSEAVFHLAALAAVARSVESPAEVVDVNVTGTLRVLLQAVAARARRVVLASSSSVYGDSPTLPKREDFALSPRSPYAASKASAEALLSGFQASYGLEGVSLRYFNVYGPRQSARSAYAAVVPRFVAAALGNETPVVYGDGEQTRDFTYVGDVVEACLLAATAPDASGAVNVGGGKRVSVNALLRTVSRETGWSGRPRHEPARVGDVRDSLADVSRAASVIGWRPSTSLEDGIGRTVRAARGAARAAETTR
jgi:nucleoside-diphosphate-sugar epimerase